MKIMNVLTDISQINREQWEQLVATSPTATWFQTREAYDFFASLPEMFVPFVVAVERIQESGTKNQNSLQGIIVGYITREKNSVKQFLTRRAIIIGGPLLAKDITKEELRALLNALRTFEPSNLRTFKPIYIESRNFNDYSRWKDTFEACGFAYQPHLNFHIDTSSVEIMESNLGKSRKRDIRTSVRDGAVVVEKPTIEQVRAYYAILNDLYCTKVKTPLFPLSFFERLWELPSAHFLLIAKEEEVLGGTVCVELVDKCLYEWFACGKDGQYKTIFPSCMATYSGMRYATEHNMPRFDMMGAGKPEEAYGVRDFKAKFGGGMVEYGRYLCICNKLLYNIGKLGVKILKRN